MTVRMMGLRRSEAGGGREDKNVLSLVRREPKET